MLAALGATATVTYEAAQNYPTGLFDLYPLYYGARAWLATGSAYDLVAVAPPIPPEASTLLSLGNAYPFPAVLLVLPLSWLPPTLAGLAWSGLLAAAVVGAVSLTPNGWWLLLYLPILEALRIQQYTALVVVMELAALHCLRQQRYWALGALQALILTKPNEGALFTVVTVLLAHNWRQFAVCTLAVWGGSLLLSPHWPLEWLPIALNNAQAVARPVYWPFALLLVPLVLVRDWVSLSFAAPVLLGQFRDLYVAAALPLGVASERRALWLAPLAWAWLIPAAVWDPGWATALLLVGPVVAVSAYKRFGACFRALQR